MFGENTAFDHDTAASDGDISGTAIIFARLVSSPNQAQQGNETGTAAKLIQKTKYR
ncbi:MAG: hypothetical protein Q7U18_03195 [Methylobacter sp.]|nr:hypothetical protein [Methylobacter sp.]